MRTHLFFSTAFFAALAAAPLGCGSLDGHTDKPTTLATIQGSLNVQGSATVGSDVRIALLWLNPTHTGFSPWDVEDLPVQPVFPASFTLPLTAPPPASAIVPENSGGSSGGTGGITGLSVGIVVAYEDVNGNGKLDAVPNDASQFVDKIVGVNTDTVVVYLTTDGTFPSSAPAGSGATSWPSAGYNLATMSCPVFPSSGAECRAQVPWKQWLPIDTTYDLSIGDPMDPRVNGMVMCQDYVGLDILGAAGGEACATTLPDGGSEQIPCPGPAPWNVAKMGPMPGGYAKAGDPDVTCHGSTSYTYSPCAAEPLCSDSTYFECKPQDVELGGAAPPSGWPCQ